MLIRCRQKLRSDFALQHEELKTAVYTYKLISSSYIRERRAARVRQWTWLAQHLGIKSGIITSAMRYQNISTVFARWPLLLPFGLSQVITAQLIFHNGLPIFPKLGLRPQNIVPNNAGIIRACEAGDITSIQGIFKARQANPNDRTTDDLTVLRVGAPVLGLSLKDDKD